MAYSMPKPRKFRSLQNCQKRFLWTHKEIDLVPHPVVGLVLQVGDVEKFPQAFGFEGLDLFPSVFKFIFIQSQKAESMFHSYG